MEILNWSTRCKYMWCCCSLAVDHEMLISILFGQMDDASLHMTSCVCRGQTGGGQQLWDGNMRAGSKWASRQAGSNAYFHAWWHQHCCEVKMATALSEPNLWLCKTVSTLVRENMWKKLADCALCPTCTWTGLISDTSLSEMSLYVRVCALN